MGGQSSKATQGVLPSGSLVAHLKETLRATYFGKMPYNNIILLINTVSDWIKVALIKVRRLSVGRTNLKK